MPRQDDGTAIIADMRNNENLNISQLHCAFLLFHNEVAAGLPAALTKDQRYIRARQLVRWAYQYIVINDYLPNVCDPVVVNDWRPTARGTMRPTTICCSCRLSSRSRRSASATR